MDVPGGGAEGRQVSSWQPALTSWAWCYAGFVPRQMNNSLEEVSATRATVDLAEAVTSDDLDALTTIDAAMRTVITPDTEPLETSLW
jgi:hypothetical protein